MQEKWFMRNFKVREYRTLAPNVLKNTGERNKQ